MNIRSVVEKRRTQWVELENYCDQLEVRGKVKAAPTPSRAGAAGVSRFATLYRAACADLALADAYQLPPTTVTYLHRLVARAHNQLYLADQFRPTTWVDVVFRDAPQQIFSDPCVRVAAIVFFGLFSLSMYFGYNEAAFPGFAESVVGGAQLEQMEEMYEEPLSASLDHYVQMSGFYIRHNTGIGLQCFGYGLLIIPCLFVLAYNAVSLGTVFGYMARADVTGSENFYQFVTAHGPFELTAIALSAGAGLRVGVGLFRTGGLTRVDSVRLNAARSVPIMSAAVVLFVLAAFTEGFLSPSPTPYLFKAAWSVISSGMISFYFVVLGFPRQMGINDAA